MFIRFVIASRDEDSGRRKGLFQAADELRASGQMSKSDEQRLDEIEQWFEENLPVPERLALSSKPRRKAQAISWFRSRLRNTLPVCASSRRCSKPTAFLQAWSGIGDRVT